MINCTLYGPVTYFISLPAVLRVPAFTFVEIFTEGALTAEGGVGAYIGTIAVAYIPVAFVVEVECADRDEMRRAVSAMRAAGLHGKVTEL